MSVVNKKIASVRLSPSNPYRNGVIFVYQDGEQELSRVIAVWAGAENDKYHNVKKGEELDFIAWKNYKDILEKPEWYWWAIADANEIENPLDLSEFIGKDLVIPDIQIFLLTLDGK